MGSCPSRFRAQFTPDHQISVNGTADIILKPVESDENVARDEEEEEDQREPFLVDVADAGMDIMESNGTATENKRQDGNKEVQVPLIVELVDLRITENTKAHNTNSFASVHSPRLVIRRGAAFKLNFVLNRPYDQEEDVLCMVFTVKDAKSPSYSQKTEIILPVLLNENSSSSSDWHIQAIITDENCITVEIVPSPNAIIGEWNLEVDSKIKNDIDAADFRYKVESPIIILFNTWCKDDTVYLPIHQHREEYILCDCGLLWRGSHNRLRPCVWNYGQFEENILECSLYLLTNVGRLSVANRSDPIRVVRHLSAVINSRDDSGVLVGNWSGKYKGGACPTSWCGSPKILQKYYKMKKPVKYGQCWVFSGVFTTVCRALGIPSRPVTNFSSAHDTHNSLTIDSFFDSKGKPVDKLNIDSVWNFHVWIEVWMQRPDLEPGGYGGWQAVDSTPQEESDGLYRCGPASVAAIKKGEVMKVYDTSFLFAEVNADKVYWRYHGANQPLKLIRKSTDEIGQCISTKAVGRFEREDITDTYKHSERSEEEREVMIRALRQCKNAFSRYYLNNDLEDVKFDLLLLDDIVIGESFTVTLKAKNMAAEAEEEDGGENHKKYSIDVCLRVHSALYTGCTQKLIKQDQFETQLEPGSEQEMKMSVNYSEYEKTLGEQCCFIISAAAHVTETGFDYCAQDDFRVRMPDIKFQPEEEIIQNQPFTITAFLTNPLPKYLKNGTFSIEGPGFGEPRVLKCRRSIEPGCEAKVTCKLTAKSAGSKTIAATFQSKELSDVDGYCQIFVKPFNEVNDKESNSHL